MTHAIRVNDGALGTVAADEDAFDYLDLFATDVERVNVKVMPGYFRIRRRNGARTPGNSDVYGCGNGVGQVMTVKST